MSESPLRLNVQEAALRAGRVQSGQGIDRQVLQGVDAGLGVLRGRLMELVDSYKAQAEAAEDPTCQLLLYSRSNGYQALLLELDGLGTVEGLDVLGDGDRPSVASGSRRWWRR